METKGKKKGGSTCLVTQTCLILATPWGVAHWAPLSMGFSKQEYWRGCYLLPQRIFPTQGSNLSPAAPALAGRFFTTSAIWEDELGDWG